MIKKLTSLLLIIFCLSKSISAEEKKLRIISLAPSTTEILFALGLDDEIVGVSSFCNYPKKALKKPKVGSFSQPDIERIVLLRPDIVFCTGLEQSFFIQRLKELNIEVFVSDPNSIEELFNSIINIAKRIDRLKEAELLILKMKGEIEKISLKNKTFSKNRRPKVFIQLWHHPLITVGKYSIIDELIFLAGGLNITHHIKGPYSHFSLEELIYYNPDIIIFTYMDQRINKYILNNYFGWKYITAVKRGNLYQDIDPDTILRPGPRLIEGLKEIYKRLELLKR
ncbi:MAG: cobalamin-binding protein [Candidatus Omnitrophica bacterium]|nr:cobalamin-binding protein [Candidatus Omnitrophota bacterium]